MSRPHFEESVRMRLTFPKVGTWSPPGFPRLQRSIIEVKTPCLDVFFIPLERSRNVDVENGFAWAIQTSAAQVMVERRVESLTPDHKKSGIDLIPVCAGGVRHTIGKLSRRTISSLQTLSQLEVGARSYERPTSRNPNQDSFWRAPKSLVEPTWGFNYVELRKVGTWGPLRLPAL